MVFKHNKGLIITWRFSTTTCAQGMRAHIATTKTADQL